MSSIDIRLDKPDRVYYPGEKVTGAVVITTESSSMSFNSIRMDVKGEIRLQLSARSVGLFEAFYSSIKPMVLLDYELDISGGGGKVQSGETEFPFEFDLVPEHGQPRFYETYHGVYVNCAYSISVLCTRGMLKSNLEREVEFIIEVPESGEHPPEPVPFEITPETLENVRKSSVTQIPPFKLGGKLFRTNCNLSDPFKGSIIVERSEAAVKSIELQLVRVETVAYAEGQAREATEIQNVQVADGDVCRDLVIPLYMVFPRLFVCPTVDTLNFKVEFELNLVVLFADGYMVTENFPLNLYRGGGDSQGEL